jgi:hypothetical protein
MSASMQAQGGEGEIRRANLDNRLVIALCQSAGKLFKGLGLKLPGAAAKSIAIASVPPQRLGIVIGTNFYQGFLS